MIEVPNWKHGIPLKIDQRIKRAFKMYNMLILLIAGMVFFVPVNCYSYIMPAEQVVSLMTANFSKFKTLLIIQSTHLLNLRDKGEEIVLEEKIWLNSSGFYRSELMDKPDGQEKTVDEIAAHRESIDMTFRRILMSNDCVRIMALLSEMGINLENVVFTRLDGVIAYRIGGKNPKSPKLIVEKERFLPLLLSYRMLDDSEEKRLTVRFHDYRKMAKGWYPYKIVCFVGEKIEGSYFVNDLKANVPIVFPVSETRKGGPKPTQMLERRQGSTEDERLKEVIKILEEKYH